MMLGAWWLVVAVITVSLTLPPLVGVFPLRSLPWSGPAVVFTWILASFDMPAAILLLPGIYLGIYSEIPLSLVPLAGALLTVSPAIVIRCDGLWKTAAARRTIAIYTMIYRATLVGCGLFTAWNWNRILD